MGKRFNIELKSKIGEKIREVRRLKGISQTELAEKVGLSYQQIQKYEKGKSSISVERLFQIAYALNVSIKTFFGEDYNKVAEGKEGYRSELFSEEEVLLIKHFRKIKGDKLRKALIEFLKELTEKEK
jgi:transcriptional regulator with XRE-family HTH domain